MPYKKCFASKCNGCIHIESVRDDDAFAEIVAMALRDHPAAPPRRRPPLSNALQGNLCEFCVWDIGERSWRLYEREFTWTANANSPWRLSSDPGIDILALDSVEDDPTVLLIEVKSSSRNGRRLIIGDGSSLQTDYRHLFSGDSQSRLQNRVGAVLSDLILKNKRPDLADKVKSAVGTSPNTCEGITLIGVLVCKRGNARSRSARFSAIQKLQVWLRSQGWRDGQFECRCIEVRDFSRWLDEVIRRAIHDHA